MPLATTHNYGVRFVRWLAGWSLVSWLVGWSLVGWLVGWLVDRLVVGWSVGWLVDRLVVGWSVGRWAGSCFSDGLEMGQK